MTLKTKIYLSISVFLILTLFLIFFLFFPLWRDIKLKSEEFLLTKEKLILLESQLRQIDELRRVEEKIKPVSEKIEALFIDKETPVEFVSFLENLSQNCEVSLKISPAPSKEIQNETWPFLDFQIGLAGSFPNISRFLEKLEFGPYLIKIENLNITRLNQNELSSKEFEKLKPGDVKVNFLLRVYGK